MHNTRTRTRNPSFLVKLDPNPTRSQKALLVMAWTGEAGEQKKNIYVEKTLMCKGHLFIQFLWYKPQSFTCAWHWLLHFDKHTRPSVLSVLALIFSLTACCFISWKTKTYLLNQQLQRQVHPSHLYWPPIFKETINQIPLHWLQNNDDDDNTFLLSPLP